MIFRKILAAGCLILSLLSLTGCGEKILADRIIEQGMKNNIVMETVTLHIENVESMTEVQPPNPSGYYDYYPAVEGWNYLVLSGTVENAGTETVSFENCSVAAQADKKEREAKIVVMNESGMEFMDEIPGNLSEPWQFYLIIALKNGEQPDQVSFCFDEGLQAHSENERWNTQLIVHLDDLDQF